MKQKKIISIEYSRSIRGKQPVSFILTKVNKKYIKDSINKITETLRQIDQIFYLKREDILVILPLTDERGLKIVVDKIEKCYDTEIEIKKWTITGGETQSLEELINDMLD